MDHSFLKPQVFQLGMVSDCADYVVIQSWRCVCWAGLGGSWPPKPNLGVSAPQPGPPAPPCNQPSDNRVNHPWAQTFETPVRRM